MSQEPRGRHTKRLQSSPRTGKDVKSLKKDADLKKISPDRKEATTGILRLDFGKPRRSSGGSVDFRGVPDRLGPQNEPPSPQPSVDRLSVTFAERSDCSESSVKVNIFDPGSPPSQLQEMEKVRFSRDHTVTDGEDEEEDDYSASVSAIMQRRESTRRSSSRKKKRRPSSPFINADGESGLFDARRRSSVYTNSSGETAISIEDGTTQEQIFENIRLHKEVLSNVKLQPWGMRRKIKLVQQAKAYVKKHEGELQERLAMSKSTKDILARFNIWLIKKLQYLRRELANTMTLLIPWELRIKEIESHFGSAVASYFTFLRWMFWVNLVITVVLACFVAIPEMLTADVKSAGERKEMLPDEKKTATNLVTLWDFEGILKYSPIFYGYYTNRDGPGTGYRLPFAYFMTGLAVYVYSFVATLRRMAENSRMSKLSEKDDECAFTWKLFSGWDYMIGNAETAHNRVASLILGFKEALLEETEKKKDEKNWKIICLRVLVNFLVLGLLVFSAYVVFIVVERSTQPEADDTWWRQNEITVSLSIISIIFPIFFEVLGMLEGYHPRKCLRVQLARIMVLNLLNLYTLIFSQFWKISKMSIELQKLKANYTTNETDGVVFGSIVTEVATFEDNCYNEPIDCASATLTTEASPLSTTIFAAAVVANITIATLMPAVNKNYTSWEVGSWSNTSLSGILNASDYYYNRSEADYTDFTSSGVDSTFPIGGYSSTESSSVETFSTEPVTGTVTREKTDSIIHNIVTVIFKNIQSSIKPSMNNRLKEKRKETKFQEEVGVTENATEVMESNETSTTPYSDPTYETVPIDESTEVPLSSTFTEERGYTVSSEEPKKPLCSIRRCIPSGTKSMTTTPRLGLETTTLYDMETKKKLRRLCWETMFGQELVKLTVMDLVFTVASIMLLDFFRAVFVRVMNNCWCWDLEKKFPQYGDFKIAENILHLVNNQGMVWMGMFFSPGLPAINLIKLAIMMYLRSWAVLTCNVPHEVVFRASRSNNFYLALLLTMLFLCVLPVGFAIVWIEPSWHCGPFSNYKRIYHLFTQSLQKALPESFHKALDYIASPGIIIPLLMLLVLIIYYLVSLTNSLREANNDLKIQLRRERTEERRKMFQLVDKRARKGSKDSETPFAKWKKLLPDLSPKPVTPSNNPDKSEKIENGVVSCDSRKDINRKELLSRLMKRALRKSSGTSDDDSQIPDDGTDGDQADSLFDEHVTKTKHRVEHKRPERSQKDAKVKIEPQPKNHQHKAKVEHQRAIKKTRVHAEKEERKSPTSAQSTQRNSLGSDWSETIPVIKISKTESEECILKDGSPKVAAKRITKGEAKKRFKEAVEKQIIEHRKNKERLSKQLDFKAGEIKTDKSDRKKKSKNGSRVKVTVKGELSPKKVEVKEEEKEDVTSEKNKFDEVEIAFAQETNETTQEEKKDDEKPCPIATEETVSSDLDLSLPSLKGDEQNDNRKQ